MEKIRKGQLNKTRREDNGEDKERWGKIREDEGRWREDKEKITENKGR